MHPPHPSKEKIQAAQTNHVSSRDFCRPRFGFVDERSKRRNVETSKRRNLQNLSTRPTEIIQTAPQTRATPVPTTITHIRIIPPLQRALLRPLLLLPGLSLPSPDRVLPLHLVLSEYQPAPALLLALCPPRFRVGDGELGPAEMVLEVLLEVDALHPGRGGGHGGAEEGGVAARRAETFGRVFTESKAVSTGSETWTSELATRDDRPCGNRPWRESREKRGPRPEVGLGQCVVFTFTPWSETVPTSPHSEVYRQREDTVRADHSARLDFTPLHAAPPRSTHLKHA